jgi:hypothetical protein
MATYYPGYWTDCKDSAPGLHTRPGTNKKVKASGVLMLYSENAQTPEPQMRRKNEASAVRSVTRLPTGTGPGDGLGDWVGDCDESGVGLGDGDALDDPLGVLLTVLLTVRLADATLPVAFTNDHVAAPGDVGLSVTIASTVGAGNEQAWRPDMTVPTDSMPPARRPVDRDRNVYRAGLLTPAVTLNDASGGDTEDRAVVHSWPA